MQVWLLKSKIELSQDLSSLQHSRVVTQHFSRDTKKASKETGTCTTYTVTVHKSCSAKGTGNKLHDSVNSIGIRGGIRVVQLSRWIGEDLRLA